MAGPILSSVLTKFQSVKKAGSGWLAKCPAHDDERASLSIGEGADGKLLLYCHAGCEPTDILHALGMSMTEIFPPKPPRELAHGILAEYDYYDVSGTLVFQVVRKHPKDFRCRQPNGDGWQWNMAGVKRVPYHLPDLVGQQTVWIVEGEKDADRLWAIGVPATTNAGGAGKWGAAETKALRDAGVQRAIVVPDNDGPGRTHAEKVAKRIKGHGLAVSIVALPGLQAHGDVSDYLDSGHTRSDLESLANVPYVVGTATVAPPSFVTVEDDERDADALDDPTAYAPAGSNGAPQDAGAGEAFRDRFGKRVRWDHAQQRWVVWEGHYWRLDADAEVDRLAVVHARKWQHEALRLTDFAQRGALVAGTLALERRSRLTSMLEIAKTLKPIASRGDEWDKDAMLLGCPNGVVDLRAGTLRNGKPEDFITHQTGHAFDPDALCPRWEQFIREIFDEDQPLIDYAHKALGYSLTGDMREQCFFLAVGHGANGKSVLLDVLSSVLGTYAGRTPMQMFAGTGNVEKFHLALLDGKRIVFASEPRVGARWNEDILKKLTGGESVSAEHKFGRPFKFQPTCKIWMTANHYPKVDDDSTGWWRRVHVVPFDRTFTGSADDKNLRETLRDEEPGILAWLVRGCLAWQQAGIALPLKVRDAVQSYEQSEDPLQEFFSERVEFDPDAVVGFSALASAYHEWCETQKIPQRERMPRRSLGSHLKKRFGEPRLLDGYPRYFGLRVRERPRGELPY